MFGRATIRLGIGPHSSYLWLGNGVGPFSKEKISEEKVKKKRISGEAYDVNKQTIYVAPKSTN